MTRGPGEKDINNIVSDVKSDNFHYTPSPPLSPVDSDGPDVLETSL